MKRALPILAGIVTTLLLAYAFCEAIWVAPTESTMGDVQRIFYYHVPSAWTAFLLFFFNFLASILFLTEGKPARRAANWIAIAITVIDLIAPFIPLIKQQLPTGMYPSSVATTALAITGLYFLIGKLFKGQSLDALAVTTAEVGVVFCTIVLITGPIWARPVWGIWWTWDMRLTLTLVLWLIYVSYLVLRRFSDSAQTPVLAAALAVFGALDVPLVYFSIWFFRTQHPQPVIGGGGSIDPRMLKVLMINWLAFSCFAFLVCWSRYRLELLKRKVEEEQALESLQGPEELPNRTTPMRRSTG
jgi:heme exporter protein C